MTNEKVLEFLKIIPKDWWCIDLYDQDGKTYRVIAWSDPENDMDSLIFSTSRNTAEKLLDFIIMAHPDILWAMFQGMSRPRMMPHPFDQNLRNQIFEITGLEKD